MSINPTSAANYSWNYSKPDKPEYSTQLVGTVLAIQEVQKMGYNPNGQPGAPEFWPDGNPKMNIRLALATQEGNIKTFTFPPASKAARMGQKKSVHIDLFALTGNTDMMNLIGKTICIQTQEGYYGQGHPRPWFVSLMDGGPFKPKDGLPSEFKVPQVLANNAVSGGQMQPQQQYQQPPMQQGYGYQQQYQQPPMQQGYGYQQQYQPQPQMQSMQQQPQPPMMQQPMQPQMQQQPMQPQMQQQPMQQPVQQGYPEGMDPNIAQAMASQVFGEGVQVTMEQPPAPQGDPVGMGQVYDNDDPDMPF